MRLYSVKDKEECTCVLVIANSAKEAKKIGYPELDCEFINVCVRWIKNADVKNEPVGLYKNDCEALKNGWYYCIYTTCPVCGKKEAMITYNEDMEKFYCCSCHAFLDKDGIDL